MKQTPMIVESTLSRPSRWFILTRYVEKKGVSTVTGDDVLYLKAITKVDVTDQMRAILKAKARNSRRKNR